MNTDFEFRFQTFWAVLAAAILLVSSPVAAQVLEGVPLFGPGDPIIAIDTDKNVLSGYPGLEGPGNVADQDSATKYLNFGEEGTGFIITPAFGSSTIQSFQMTTANDFPIRDPASFDLYGTNDPITSGDNSLGDQENWTLIASDDLDLPPERETLGPIVNFANGTAYTSYKMIFPTIKNPDLAIAMQVADVQLFTGAFGGGLTVLAAGDPALAVTDNFGSESDYPGNEGPENVIDQTLAKYLNFGVDNTGFIVSRLDGQSVVVTSFTITTANDLFERDPTSFELYGTNDPVTSEDNSSGDQENWTLVDMGSLDLPVERDTESDPIVVSNATTYSAYRMIFPTIRLPANSMQVAEVTMVGDLGGAVTVAATSFLVTEGDFVFGGLPELEFSDNMDLTLRRRNADLQSRTEFEVKSVSPTATPGTFEFTLEGSVFARGNVVQTIELFDYDLGVWELVDTSNANRAPMPDKVVTATPAGDLSRFVEAGTMCIEARIRYKSDRNRQKFASNTDQAVWTIGQ